MGLVAAWAVVYYVNRYARLVLHAVVGTVFDPAQDVVLVTGGAGGLGRAAVERFAATGATVVAWDIVVPECSERVAGVHYYQCDVGSRHEVLETGARVKAEVGVVTVLVNNAGITHGKRLVDMLFEAIDQTIQVNLLASFYTTKVFLPDMLEKRRGYVVTIALVLGYMLPARLSAYGASKSGLIALHELLTYELGPPLMAPLGVKTLLVCPGQMRTRMFTGVRTPSTALAPELDPAYVAESIVLAVQLGRRGEIRLPFYGNFLPVFRAAPWPVVEFARHVLGIDKSMALFLGRVSRTTLESASIA